MDFLTYRDPASRLSIKTTGGLKMASINPNTLTEPIYVRLTLEIAEEIRKQAIQQERTQSSQIRFLLQKALRMEEQEERRGAQE